MSLFWQVIDFIITLWYSQADSGLATAIHSFMALMKADHLVQNLYELMSSNMKVNFNINIIE